MADNCNCIPEESINPGINQGTHEPTWTENKESSLELLRAQEMLSTIEEKTDHEVSGIKPCDLDGTTIDLSLELGQQIILVPGDWRMDVTQWGWENSNPQVILLQPTQSLSQGQVMALKEGTAEVKASCLHDYSKFYQWNITVGNGETTNSSPEEEEKPTPEEPGCDCSDPEQVKEALKAGGIVKLAPEKTTQVDLGEGGLRLEGVTTELEMNSNVKLVAEGNAIVVGSGATLKITGEGTVTGGEGKSGAAISVESGAKVEIEGGNFIATGDETGEGNSCIYSKGGKVEIKNGTFESTTSYKNKYYTLNVQDSLVTSGSDIRNYIEVSGGTFKNFDPSLGDQGHGGTFVKDGYKSEAQGSNTWKVVPEE